MTDRPPWTIPRCGGYGFPKLTETAARAEASIKANAAIETVKSQVEELIGLIRGTRGYNPAQEKQTSHAAPVHE